jgi:ring-1,2-phenylacetyl-CoA epoxidase subunit PaaE
MARPPLKLDLHTLLLLLVQWLLFVGNFVVYATSPGPLWIHMAISVVAIHLAFTIWHESAHGTVSNRKWLNNAVGIAGMLPYTTPYFLQRFVHLEHHKYLNDPEHDPNQIYADGPLWQLPVRYLRTIGYARRMLSDDPRTPTMRLSDAFFLALVASVYVLAFFQGFLVDLVLLWLVPVVIGKVILDLYVNYLPHVGLPQDRFLGTRIIDTAWLTPLVLGHNYHAVHHLWPTIPWHGYLARYREKGDYLRENGVPIETRLFGRRLHPTRPQESATDQPEDVRQHQKA